MANNNPKKTVNKGVPKLDGFISPGKKKFYATYAQVASYYSLPYYTAVKLAKEANANIHIRKSVLVDMDVVNNFMESELRSKGE